MEHIAALLLVVGCQGNLAACEQIPVESPAFETREACARELYRAQRTLGRNHSAVYFKCIDVDPALDHEDAKLVWNIGPGGQFYAEVEAPHVMIALNETGREHN